MPVILGLFFRWTTFLLRVCYESPRVLINVTPGCAQNSSEGFLSKCVSEDNVVYYTSFTWSASSQFMSKRFSLYNPAQTNDASSQIVT